MTIASHDWMHDSIILIMTMRRDDAQRWDAQRMVALAQSLSVDTLGFSVGGITAFYPTNVPLHERSPTLGERDVVAETITALRRESMHVLGRIDPSLAGEAVHQARPHWLARREDGSPIRLHGHYVTCPSGGYYREFMVEVVREILTRYDFDGLWGSAAQFSPWHTPRCFCDACRQSFLAHSGMELPEREDWASERWRRYNEWRYESVADWNRLIHDAVRETRPSCAWLPLSQVVESWDHARRGGWDTDLMEPHTDGLVVEAQRRYPNLWWPGMEARYLHSLRPGKPAGATVSYFYPWWRFYHAPTAENRVWTAQLIAQNTRPWLHLTGYFSDHFDRRGLDQFKQLFARIRASPEAYSGTRSCAEVALVYSRHTLDNHGGDEPAERYLGNFRGAYNALLAQRIPFDVLSDKRLAGSDLGRYRTLVVPNAVCLSDTAVRALIAYAERGGHLVTTLRSGACDEWGVEREVNPLAQAAGFQSDGPPDASVKAAYAAIVDPAHPLLRGIENTDVLPVTGRVTFTRSLRERPSPLHYIPPIESEPGSGISVPEFNTAPEVTDVPLLHEAEVSRGSIVAFPWELDRMAFEYGFEDCMTLLGNAVRAGKDHEAQLEIDGAGLIDASLMAGNGRLVLHLVNLSASGGGVHAGERRAVEQIMPVANLRIRLRLPPGAQALGARWVGSRADTPLAEPQPGWVELILPELREFETLVIHHMP